MLLTKELDIMPMSTNENPKMTVLRVPIFFITIKLTGLKQNVTPKVREPTKPKTVTLEKHFFLKLVLSGKNFQKQAIFK